MRVDARRFIEKYTSAEYRHGMYLGEDLFAECLAAEATGKPVIEVPDDIYEVVETRKVRDEEREAAYQDISTHRLNGMGLERQGDLEGAAREYELAISLGERTDMFHAYAHAYHRLFVVLRKLKEHSREERYLSRYLEHELDDRDRERYADRLRKLRRRMGKEGELVRCAVPDKERPELGARPESSSTDSGAAHPTTASPLSAMYGSPAGASVPKVFSSERRKTRSGLGKILKSMFKWCAARIDHNA